MNRRLASLVVCFIWLLAGGAALAQVSPGPQTLADALQSAGPNEEIPVIVELSDHVNVGAFQGPDKDVRRAQIVQALQAEAASTQGPVTAFMRAGGASGVTSLWIINGIAAGATPGLIRAVTNFPGVQSVTLDAKLKAPPVTLGTAAAPEWNIADIHAPDVWNLGFTGAGVVVANMDTGVDVNHPDLGSKWRGGTDSWLDPFKKTTVPYDAIGHGTQTMGIMVGGSAGGTAIGVAPDATWIAAKIFDDSGNTTVSTIHGAFQWLLAPSGNPPTPDAPDVVNASWGLPYVNTCDNTFQTDFDTLRAAGIVVVFAAGNSGPKGSTSISPANNVDGFSAGAVDNTNTIASFSSRGPSACTNGVYPDTVAPGVNVKTSDLSLAGTAQYTYVSGTSYSAPHVAGAAALLLSALPTLRVTDIEGSLETSATDLGSAGADDNYGYGLINVLAAYDKLASSGTTNLPPVANNDTATTPRNAAVTINVLANDTEPDDGIDPASLAIVANPSHGTAAANSNGAVTYTPKRNFTGTDSFKYTVKDKLGATSNAATVTVTVTR